MNLLPFVAIQQPGAADSASSRILRSVYSYRRQRSANRRHRTDTAPSREIPITGSLSAVDLPTEIERGSTGGAGLYKWKEPERCRRAGVTH